MTDAALERAERRAWDFCAEEHGWQQPCIRCQSLADAFLKWEAAALRERDERAEQAERERDEARAELKVYRSLGDALYLRDALFDLKEARAERDRLAATLRERDLTVAQAQLEAWAASYERGLAALRERIRRVYEAPPEARRHRRPT